MSDVLTLRPENTEEKAASAPDLTGEATIQENLTKTSRALRVGVGAALATVVVAGAAAYGIDRFNSGRDLQGIVVEDTSRPPITVPSPRPPLEERDLIPSAGSTSVTATKTIDTGVPITKRPK